MGKTRRHKGRMEDSADLFDRRKNNRGKSSSRKHRKSDGQRLKGVQEYMGGLGPEVEESEWED